MDKKLFQLKNTFSQKQQKQVDLRKLILPINNNFVSIPDYEFQERIAPTDYAVAQGVVRFDENTNQPMCFYWSKNTKIPHGRNEIGIVPTMRLDLQSMLNQKWEINQTNQTIEFGYYPKSELHTDVELLRRTGKNYCGNAEYVRENYPSKQIVVEAQNMTTPKGWSFYINEVLPQPDRIVHLQVEPLIWKIDNWENMPKAFNPNGDGKAEYMNVHATQAITGGIPYERIQTYLNKEFVREAFVFSKDLTKTLVTNQDQQKNDMGTTL